MAFEMEKKPALYVAVVKSSAVRDAQIDTGRDSDPGDEDKWLDLNDVELYAGVFSGEDEADVRSQAAAFMMTDEANIRLIPADGLRNELQAAGK